METVRFGSSDVNNRLATDPQYAEYLPFGAILLDASGAVRYYNKAESMISSRLPEDVIGKNFFNEVAPCSKGRALHGRFFEAVAKGQIDQLFEYQFDYKMQPTKVTIHMKSTDTREGVWIFVKRLGGGAQ